MPVPTSARRHYRWSELLAIRAVREARKQRSKGVGAVATVVALHQATAARQAAPAVGSMLDEQAIDEAAQAILNALAFVTLPDEVALRLEQTRIEHEFDRLVAGLVQEAGRSAEQVAVTVRPRIGYVRYLSPPSCSRCTILAGRVYRYSEGFLRHPGCDCIHVPTTLANPAFVYDPLQLARDGLVTGLSKADRKALEDGADMAQIVNVRSRRAGLSDPSGALVRAGRPTPAGIYAAATSREDAIERLIAAGYIR